MSRVARPLHEIWDEWLHIRPLAHFDAAKFQKTSTPSVPRVTAPGCAYRCAQTAHTRRANTGRVHRPDRSPTAAHRTTQSARVSYTTQPVPPAAQTASCPQLAQALLLILKLLHSLLVRKSCWGQAVPHPGIEARKTRVSLIPISFQDGVRRSTVVVRQPYRPSERITGTGVRRRGPRHTRGGAAEVSLAVRGDEGTQWTWRRPPSA
jgi:hypothetical protein